MLLVLILGRWILPKGDISRDHLSQLLLVFLAMAADMVELFDTFKEKQVKYNMKLTMIVLAIWSVSLIQFPLVLTGKSRKGRLGTLRNYSNQTFPRSSSRSSSLFHINPTESYHSFCHVICTDVNFWGVLTSTVFQDGPFLATRLYLLIAHQTISYTMMFFTIKNLLVVTLQFYRLMVVCCETHKDVEHCRVTQAFAQHSGAESCLVSAAAATLTMIHDEELGQFRERFNSKNDNNNKIVKGKSNEQTYIADSEDFDDLDSGFHLNLLN